MDDGDVATSIIVACELKFGAERRRSVRLTRQLNAVLQAIVVLPFEPPADAAYARIRSKLETDGTPIGGNDMLIAAQAIALDLTLVTGNEREFGRVAGLKIENWLLR